MKKWLSEELEEIPCDFCGSSGVARQFIRADGMRVVECAVCGLAYLNPRPKPDFIKKFYQKDYFTGEAVNRGEGGIKCNLDIHPLSQTDNKKDLPRAIEIVKEKFGGLQGKDVLEIGCATGDLLLEMKIEGACVKGLEISEFATKIARKRGLDVTVGTIEDYVSDHCECFDILVAFEVIEHVFSPVRFIQNASKLMRQGGLLLLSTPNYACVNRFGKDWFGFNASFEHIYFLSIDVLTKIATQSGFVNKYWETSHYLGWAKCSSVFVNRQFQRLLNFFFIIKEHGFLKAVKFIRLNSSNLSLYRNGHSILLILIKNNNVTI